MLRKVASPTTFSKLLRRDFSAQSYVQDLGLPEKLATLEKFKFAQRTHTIGDINTSYEQLVESQESVTIHGWMNTKSKKISKKLLFGKIRDNEGGTAQFVVNDDALIRKISKYNVEDAITLQGTIVNKKKVDSKEAQNWEFKVENSQNLNAANVTAAQLENLKHVSPFEFPSEYRYLQLRQPVFQDILRKRSQASQIIRKELSEQYGFTEIETPLLFKSTPEGAREFLVLTRNKDMYYALPQSPQQYKQLLMASGVSRYFQIAKCFRDEDLRADRQPEFTQVDLEMAFSTASDVQSVVEKIVNKTWLSVRGVPLLCPVGTDSLSPFVDKLPKLNYTDAMSLYGIDKPDLRSTLSFVDVSEFCKSRNADFEVVEACVLRDLKCSIDELVDAKEYKYRVPSVAVYTEDNPDWWKSLSSNVLEVKDGDKLAQTLGLQNGDVVTVSTRSAKLPYENPTPLGRLRQLAIAKNPGKWLRQTNGSEVSTKDMFAACWVENFPLFSPEIKPAKGLYPEYDLSAFEATHHPFTMLKLEDYDYLANEKDFLKIRGDHYDLVINGNEVGGGSRRIHDPVLQNYIFKNVLKIKDPERLFGHLLKAFDLGTPPHAGLAIGFDRMMALLLDHQSIRNVIAFPKNQSGADLVVNSPSNVPRDIIEKMQQQ